MIICENFESTILVCVQHVEKQDKKDGTA